jgi:hypothetical protein
MGQEDTSGLITSTFKELYEQSKLPSGLEFELQPDTVENALAVAEIDDPQPWKKKALQVFTVTKSVNGVPFHDDDGSVSLVNNMLDTDIQFLSLAWTAQLNGTKMDLDGGAPCPSCNKLILNIDYGNLKVHHRDTPATGPGMHEVEGIDPAMLPKTLVGGKMAVADTSWMNARKRVTEKSWENLDAIMMHRIMSALYVIKGDSGNRIVTNHEAMAMRSKVLLLAKDVMDQHVPHFDLHMILTCPHCKEDSMIPFTQGLG